MKNDGTFSFDYLIMIQLAITKSPTPQKDMGRERKKNKIEFYRKMRHSCGINDDLLY